MKIVKSTELPWEPSLNRGAYGQQRKPLSTGQLAAGVWELPAGKKSFPMHAHHVTEEALYVLTGTCLVRTPEGDTRVGPGDWVSFPPGGVAHQLVNDGTEPCTYLAMSVTKGVDVVEYPANGKVAASLGSFPTGKRFMFRTKDQVDYFADDPDAG